MLRRPPRSTLFPTRRSSDLLPDSPAEVPAFRRKGLRVQLSNASLLLAAALALAGPGVARADGKLEARYVATLDRKSTRLNSSHMSISYAVFCLKKKKKIITT